MRHDHRPWPWPGTETMSGNYYKLSYKTIATLDHGESLVYNVTPKSLNIKSSINCIPGISTAELTILLTEAFFITMEN